MTTGILAKPKGHGHHAIHLYAPNPQVAGMFSPICRESRRGFMAWHLTFKPDNKDSGWGRICSDCLAIQETTNDPTY